MEDLSRILVKRVNHLEHEVLVIRNQIGRPSRVKKGVGFVLSNWGFCASMIVFAVAVWVYFFYGVGFFEAQQNIAQMKAAAEFYRKLGDHMMLQGEWKNAGEAYQSALKINQNNAAAQRGLWAAQVFDTPAGQNELNLAVVDMKIRYLETLFTDPRESFIISYFRGLRFEEQRRYAEAKNAYQEATSRNPDFFYGYVASAYVSILAQDGVDFGITQLQTAVRLDPNSAVAHNNLAYCFMVKGQFGDALEHFRTAERILPFFEVFVDLGEALRYQGGKENLTAAISYHKRALDLLVNAGDEDEDSITGELALNYMPTRTGDNKSPTGWATFSTIAQKKSLVFYQLSLDYATGHDWKNADRAFAEGLRLDADHTYAEYADNRMQSMEGFPRPLTDTLLSRWLEEKRRRLQILIVPDELENAQELPG